MGPPSHTRSVVDRNVVMRRIYIYIYIYMVTCYVRSVQSCHHGTAAVNSDVQLSDGVQHHNDYTTFT